MPGRRVSRRQVLAAGACALGVTALGGSSGRAGPDEPGPGVPGRASAARRPVLGILQAEPEQFADLRATGLTSVSVNVPWDRLEPARGEVDARFVDGVRRHLDRARSAGLDVALIPGTQYPPGWVFAAGVDGGRFVDQHGTPWHGAVGDDVADAVFDEQVREAHGQHLHRLGTLFADHAPEVVRVGGLARGELHYPFADHERAPGTLWAYGAAARRRSPVPGLRPGDGSEGDTAALVDWYLQSLADFGRWELEVVREAFGPGPTALVLQPSWGLRPGDVEEAVASGLDGGSRAERRGTLTEGLDWHRQLVAFADVPGAAVCTTWLDTPDQGDDPGSTSPGRYLAGLAAGTGLPVWGENTGGNDVADLARCVDLVDELGLGGLFWMGAADLGRAGNAGLDDLGSVLARAGHAPD